MMNKFEKPVVFIIFKRPEETRRVFEAIKSIQPTRLLIISDGPRNQEEAELVKQTRQVVENIDWPCEVKRNYSEKNLGCKIRVSSGLDWVFEQVEEAIILEDDCLPNEDFFKFCSTLLDKYRDNEKVMHISGVNFHSQSDKRRNSDSYYFSTIPHIWGWATWRRAWQKNDVLMKNWPNTKSSQKLTSWLRNPTVIDYWLYVFERMYQGLYDTWDIAWTYACMAQNGLCITPNFNLVSNIGFSDSATHSSLKKASHLANQPFENLPQPIKHPVEISVNQKLDKKTLKIVFGIKDGLKRRLVMYIKNNFPKLFQTLKG